VKKQSQFWLRTQNTGDRIQNLKKQSQFIRSAFGVLRAEVKKQFIPKGSQSVKKLPDGAIFLFSCRKSGSLLTIL